MKYEIQTKPLAEDNWHSFASADDFIVANTIMETYIDRFESMYFRIINTSTKEATI